MPILGKTQAGRRPNCTATAGIFSAGGMAVCRDHGTVALHFGTPAGNFVFRLSEKTFVRACRGAVDHNGNPFRTLAELERVDAGEIVVPAAEPAPTAPQRFDVVPATIRRHAAWKALQLNPAQALRDVAADYGLSYDALSSWINHQHRGEISALRRSLGVSLKPARRPHSLASAAARGEPLLKPKGTLA